MVVSTVYNLEMIKFVYVQVRGIEKAAKIRADEVVEQGIGSDAVLILKKEGKPVGQFRADSVQGWWIEDLITT